MNVHKLIECKMDLDFLTEESILKWIEGVNKEIQTLPLSEQYKINNKYWDNSSSLIDSSCDIITLSKEAFGYRVVAEQELCDRVMFCTITIRYDWEGKSYKEVVQDILALSSAKWVGELTCSLEAARNLYNEENK